MGISTIQSYQGSKIFEAIGISADVIEKYFTGTVSRVGGITLKDIEKDVDARHSKAFDPLGLTTNLQLDSLGMHKQKVKAKNIVTIHRPFMHYSRQPNVEIITYSNSTPAWLIKNRVVI